MRVVNDTTLEKVAAFILQNHTEAKQFHHCHTLYHWVFPLKVKQRCLVCTPLWRLKIGFFQQSRGPFEAKLFCYVKRKSCSSTPYNMLWYGFFQKGPEEKCKQTGMCIIICLVRSTVRHLINYYLHWSVELIEISVGFMDFKLTYNFWYRCSIMFLKLW